MFTKIATVVAFCDREVQFWRVVVACTWIFSYEKGQSWPYFLVFSLRLLLNFLLFASFAGEICVLHRCAAHYFAVSYCGEPLEDAHSRLNAGR